MSSKASLTKKSTPTSSLYEASRQELVGLGGTDLRVNTILHQALAQGTRLGVDDARKLMQRLTPDLNVNGFEQARNTVEEQRSHFTPEAYAALQGFFLSRSRDGVPTDLALALDPSKSLPEPRPLERWHRADTLRGPVALLPEADDFVPSAKPEQANQGDVGDCGTISFMNAANAMMRSAAVPNFIASRIHRNAEGTEFSTTFFVRNRAGGPLTPVQVTVDDKLYQADAAPIGAHSNDAPEDWAAIYEKLFAKLRGGYQTIVGLQPDIILQTMTGHEVEHTSLSPDGAFITPAALFTRVKKSLAAHQAVIASTWAIGTGRAELGAAGVKVLPNHAYAVLDARVSADGQEQLLVDNPWGTEHRTHITTIGPDVAMKPVWLTPQEMLAWFECVDSAPLDG